MHTHKPLFRDMGISNLITPQTLALLPIWMMHQAYRFALVKLGGGITGISGSIGGNTHARNRFGNYMRPRTKPVNPRSDRQVEVRSILQMLTEYWNSANMSDTERASWATYAAAIAMNNRLGETVYLTGFNHFIRSNVSRIIAGGDLVEPGPTELVLPGADNTIAVSADPGSQLLTIAFDEDQDWVSETDGFLSVEMGQPQNHTRNFFGGPWRNAGSVAGNTGSPPTSPVTLPAPFTLVAGQKIWARARIIRTDGRASNMFYAPSLIVGDLVATYGATGTLSPDSTCNYDVKGAFNGKPYYKRRVAGYFMWWDGTDSWYISAVLGTPGAGYWKRTNASPVGVFTHGGTATGDATVAAGEHP
jgi:hypothetical protein